MTRAANLRSRTVRGLPPDPFLQNVIARLLDSVRGVRVPQQQQTDADRQVHLLVSVDRHRVGPLDSGKPPALL